MKCILCSEDIKILFNICKDIEYGQSGVFDFLLCSKCGLISIDPVPSVEQLISYYPKDYHGYDEPKSALTKFLIRLNLQSRVRYYKKLIGDSGKILEVGAADGRDFSFLRRFGNWEYTGIEFNDDIAKIGRDAGLNIITGTLEEYDFKTNRYDLILMNNLIEHVVDPEKTMDKALRLLSERGVIIGETPNTQSWDLKLFHKYWGGLHTPRHVYLFDQKNLRLLIRDKAEIFIKQKIDTNHWAGSLQNFFQSKNITKTKTQHGRTWYYPFLLILFVPLNFIAILFGYSGVMSFTVKKREVKDFESWNEKMAIKYNPDNYHKSGNPLIRFIESRRTKAIIKLLDLQEDDGIVDLGCGAGNIMEKIDVGNELTGIDISEYLLGIARKKTYKIITNFIKGDVQDLGRLNLDKKYEKIYCSEVLEHVPDPQKILEGVKTLAKNDAVIVISFPNENLINALKMIFKILFVFQFLFPGISKKMDDEWHLHKFNLRFLNSILPNYLAVNRVVQVPFYFLPIRYVVKLVKRK
jgi:2-polyprenyl-3-methyl-5-hydroxy-6-metoxy-1,4-benzoquinol methylase